MKRRDSRQKIALFLILIAVPLLLLNLKIKKMLLDDGYETYYVNTMLESLKNLDIRSFLSILFENGRRLRPVFWLYYMFVWWIGGPSPFLLRFTHVVIYALLIIFVYLTVKKLVKPVFAPAIAVLYFLLTNINTENLMRVGPQEPLVSLFALISFYLLFFSRNLKMVILFVFLTIFSKENGFAIIPGLIFFTLLPFGKKLLISKDKIKLIIFSTNLFLISVLPTLLNRGGYSADYITSPALVIGNFFWFAKEIFSDNYLLIIPSIGAFLFMVVRYKFLNDSEKKILFSSLVFALASASFIVVQSPWKHLLSRYIFPASTFISVFIGVNFGYLMVLFKKAKISKYLKWIIGVIFYFLFAYWVVTRYLFTWFSTVKYIRDTNLVYSLTSYIADSVPKDSNIYVNLADSDFNIETVTELEFHEHLFFKRPDIKVSYLNYDLPNGAVVIDTNLGKKDKNNLAFTEELKNYESLKFENEGRVPIFTTPTGLIKELVVKTYKFVNNKMSFTQEGLFTFYIYNNTYTVYKL